MGAFDRAFQHNAVKISNRKVSHWSLRFVFCKTNVLKMTFIILQNYVHALHDWEKADQTF